MNGSPFGGVGPIRVAPAPEAPKRPETVREALRCLLETMWTADVASEGREVLDRGRVRVTAGWQWLDWQFGAGVHLDLYAQDGPMAGAWCSFGPASLGVTVTGDRR